MLFCQALTTAAVQEAKSLELRAAMSLVRMDDERYRSESTVRLKETYLWFAEGHKDKDLSDAWALLKG